MAPRRKAIEAEGEFHEDPSRSGPKDSGRNGLDPALTKSFVARVEGLFDDLISEKSSYMQRAKTIRQTINAVYDDAQVEGIPRKELKSVIKARGYERKIANLRDDLERDERETYDMIVAALGDLAGTPLGEHAVAGASH